MSTPQFFQTRSDLWNICSSESEYWVECLRPHAEFPKSQPMSWNTTCAFDREEFEKCVLAWRSSISDPIPEKIIKYDENGSELSDDEMTALGHYSPHLDPKRRVRVRVTGKEGRMLPPQCDEMRQVLQRCTVRSGFEPKLCKTVIDSIKLCTRLLYGQEFIDEKSDLVAIPMKKKK